MDRQKRILVIEDDLETRSLMTNIFVTAGYQVEATQYLASMVAEATSGKIRPHYPRSGTTRDRWTGCREGAVG